jgi:cold shock CspA family protein
MKEGITVVVHYPITKEGMKALEESQARVMFSILENQLGPQMVEKLVARMKEKTTMDK